MHKIISLIFLTLFLFSCNNRNENLLPDLTEKLSLVRDNDTEELDNYYSQEQKNKTTILNLKGFLTLKFDELFTVKTNTNGFVKHIYISEGSFVNKGETIALIEDEKLVDLQEEYLILKNQITKNNEELQNLKTEGNDLKKSKTELDFLNIRLKAIEQKLLIYSVNPYSINVNNIQKHVKIVAPTSGILTSLNIIKGEYISESYVIANIEKSTDRYLKIKVETDYLQFIKKGQKVSAFSINNPDKQIQLKAVISEINNEPNEDGTISIFAKIINNESSKFSENIRYNTNFEFDVIIENTDMKINYGSERM